MNDDYRMGFRDGMAYQRELSSDRGFSETIAFEERITKKASKRRVKQSPKQKLLTQMTKKKWDKYKKGRGRKTYVQIRAEVSRSQAFKKKAKRL